MKIQKHLLLICAIFFLSLFSSCDELNGSKDDEPEMLHVKFMNDSTSLYTITNIQLQAMGKADEEATPSGEWSENILQNGNVISPGSSVLLDLEIPNLHWSEYRLGVDDGQGNEILLWEQTNYNQSGLPITHWGSDDRTVTVKISYESSSGLIYVSAWGDWAGID